MLVINRRFLNKIIKYKAAISDEDVYIYNSICMY